MQISNKNIFFDSLHFHIASNFKILMAGDLNVLDRPTSTDIHQVHPLTKVKLSYHSAIPFDHQITSAPYMKT